MGSALEERAEKYYEWQQDHAKVLGSAAFSLAALVLAPLLAAVLEPDVDVAVWHGCLFAAAAAIAMGVGVWWHVRAARYQREYLRGSSSAVAPEAEAEAEAQASGSETDRWG